MGFAVKQTIVTAFLIMGAFAASSVLAKPTGFYIEQLPKGSDVTLPLPATTFIPLAERVLLSSTDMPQTISFKAINITGASATSIRVAIYDANAPKVHYADVKPGTPYLYNFRELSSITIIPSLANGSKDLSPFKNLKLQVESDKPLAIAH